MARKKEIVLRVDCELLGNAHTKKLDLAEVLETALCRLGCENPERREARWQAWRLENREAIIAMNQEVEKHGLWWEKLVPSRKTGAAAKRRRKSRVR